MNQCQSCMFDDCMYYTEEEYLEELQIALSVFDEPDDFDDDFDYDPNENVVWANVN